MKSYGSFCPVAKASEVLAERWTLLVVRELLLGSRHFNDSRRGLPHMSPTLLCKRLQSLEEAGILVHQSTGNGQGEYRPTQSCEELRPLIEGIGQWGQRWVRSHLTQSELHPGEVMWYIHRHFKKEHLPARRVVIYVEITDARRLNRWWLVAENGDVELCLDDPGHEVDIFFYTDLRTLTQIYIGDLTLDRARELRKIKLIGPRELTRGMGVWFGRSRFAAVNPLPAD